MTTTDRMQLRSLVRDIREWEKIAPSDHKRFILLDFKLGDLLLLAEAAEFFFDATDSRTKKRIK